MCNFQQQPSPTSPASIIIIIMANNVDYSSYRKFLEDFAASVDPTDQLPVRVAGYTLTEPELVGEIMDWTYQYLADK